MQDSCSMSTALQGVRENQDACIPTPTTSGGLNQQLNRLEFIVGVDGSSVFPHRGEGRRKRCEPRLTISD